MNPGDIVRVRLKTSPETLRIGVVIREARKMFMVGEVIDVMVDGKIFHVREDHVEKIK